MAARANPEPPAGYVWRKLSGAKWEDAWWDRLAGVRDRLAITALAGAKTIRLEAFQLTKAQAERLRKAFGGTVAVQKAPRAVSEAVRAPIRVRGKLVVVGTEREREALGARREVLRHPGGDGLWHRAITRRRRRACAFSRM